MKISSNEQTQKTILQGVIEENNKSNDFKEISDHNIKPRKKL